jgi:hypothetical protein
MELPFELSVKDMWGKVIPLTESEKWKAF